jgi:hypothetical protein
LAGGVVEPLLEPFQTIKLAVIESERVIIDSAG